MIATQANMISVQPVSYCSSLLRMSGSLDFLHHVLSSSANTVVNQVSLRTLVVTGGGTAGECVCAWCLQRAKTEAGRGNTYVGGESQEIKWTKDMRRIRPC